MTHTSNSIAIVSVLIMAVAIVLAIIAIQVMSLERLATAKVIYEAERDAEQLQRANSIIESLPGGVVTADLSGLPTFVNTGCHEIVGLRAVQVGQKFTRIICDDSLRRYHDEVIFGPDAEAIWQKRRDAGALIAACELYGATGRNWRIIRVTAVEADGDKLYDLFIDPRTYQTKQQAEAQIKSGERLDPDNPDPSGS